MTPLIRIEKLELKYENGRKTLPAVGPLDLEIRSGEALGLIGESGAGKSTLGLCLLGLLARKNGRITGGRIVSALKAEEIAYIPQDPQASLDPLCAIGKFLNEICPDPGKITEALRRVRLTGERNSLKSYPHELSGGMQQRLLIAAALLRSPKMIIADEPTASLDMLLQREIVRLFKEIQNTGITFLFISHNIALAGTFCDRLAIMKNGRVVEVAPTGEIFKTPSQNYTRELIDSLPEVSRD